MKRLDVRLLTWLTVLTQLSLPGLASLSWAASAPVTIELRPLPAVAKPASAAVKSPASKPSSASLGLQKPALPTAKTATVKPADDPLALRPLPTSTKVAKPVAVVEKPVVQPAKAAVKPVEDPLALRPLPTPTKAANPSAVVEKPVVPAATPPAKPADDPLALRPLPTSMGLADRMALVDNSQPLLPQGIAALPPVQDNLLAQAPLPPTVSQPSVGSDAGPVSPVGLSPASRATMPASPLQIVTDSATQQLPAGTLLRLAFQNGLNSAVTQPGEPFTTQLTDDLMGTRGDVLLPKGTTLRGRVSQVQASRFFSRGGAISLDFDHVVLPTGEQMPITLQLSTDEQGDMVNKQGVLYTDPGLGAKVNASVNDGTELFYKTTQAGVKAGKDIGKGAGMILTVPVAAVGGALAGTGVAAGKSAYNLVAKGKDVVLTPGQIVLVKLSQPTSFPVAD